MNIPKYDGEKHKNIDTYKVGSAVLEDGHYICVPCGMKKYFKAGERFTNCVKCLGKSRKMFRKNMELWEKASDK
jgi:hypothetical protein